MALSTSSCDNNSDEPNPCEGTVYYGPPPCTNDAQCQDEYGTDMWYCDEDNVFIQGECQTTWPVCREKVEDCGVIVYYGPPPCDSNLDCIAEHGLGWYCDLENKLGEDCSVSMPVCRLDNCEVAVYYGVLACTSDQDCIDLHDGDATWYCDGEATLMQGDCEIIWPDCKQLEAAPLYGVRSVIDDPESEMPTGNGWYIE